MTSTELQEHLKSRLITSIDDTLKQLRVAFEKNEEVYDSIILLTAEYTSLLQKELIRTESADEIGLKMNGLRSRILTLIKLITEAETKRYNFSFTRLEKILVLSPTEQRKGEMKKLFPDQLWKRVAFYTTTDLSSINELDTYELLVFDNHDSPDPDRPPALEYLLEHTTKYILFYGGQSTLVREKHTRIYAANSIFSFHGRLQELLTFVREFPTAENPNHGN